MGQKPSSHGPSRRYDHRGRRRPGYAEVTATIALVLAMSGGALAAGHYLITSTKQIKPSVLRHLKGARGPRGATGSRGATGLPGAGGQPGGDGQPGSGGPPGAGINGIFGNGADGNQTISANTTLARDTYYGDLTVASGVTLNAGGFRIFVAGTLTLQSGSRIDRDGGDASASTPGAGVTAGSLGGSAPGANHNLCAGGSGTNSVGGTGGTGAGCPGGLGPRPAAAVGGPQAFDAALQAISGRTLDGVVVSGGTGGGGGSTTSDNGGGGGGVVVIAARAVTVNGSAVISAVGGANSGDGGGGGGGVVVVVSTSPQPSGLTVTAAGGGGSPHTGNAGFSNWLN
jgi:hypothetical protein